MVMQEIIRLREQSREYGRLRIVVLAPSEEPVPPRTYGGSELVAYNVTEELVRRGHEVYLIAAGTSTTSAILVPIAEKSFREVYANSPLKNSPSEYQALREYWNVKCAVEATAIIRSLKPDIVHNHIDWLGVVLQNLMPCPIMTTMHNLIKFETQKRAILENPNGNFVSISNNQRKDLPQANWGATIYNGIDVNMFSVGSGDGGYFAFLGRICPEKGCAEVCRIVKSLGFPHRLKIAAKIDAVNMEYYETEVKPLIDGVQIEYIGEVDFDGKNALLKDAKALLLWLNWEEPFGLVVAEANACGTPVVVNRRGSMLEVIEDGVNGILVNTTEEMRDALDKVADLDRSKCRAYVESRFDVKHMVDGYEKFARTIVGSTLQSDNAKLITNDLF
ncbi:unnamed protein product [Calypogeia fissa]